MDTLLSLRVFALVAEWRSFTAAATRLGLSSAMASKHIAHLEGRLGTRLLNRTSRQVSLTETGTLYLAQVRQMLGGLDEIEAVVSNVAVTPRGILRLSAPIWVASSPFATMLADYRRLYPEVYLDIDLSGKIVNLVDEGFDLALRATTPDRLDMGLVARPLMPVAFRLVATPAYLDQAGRPTRASSLGDHALLLYSAAMSGGSLVIDDGHSREAVRVWPVVQSENETMLYFAALQGMGLAFLPTWMAQDDITAGSLEEVMADQITFRPILYAVYPSRRYLSAKVRTFIDFLVTRCNTDSATSAVGV